MVWASEGTGQRGHFPPKEALRCGAGLPPPTPAPGWVATPSRPWHRRLPDSFKSVSKVTFYGATLLRFPREKRNRLQAQPPCQPSRSLVAAFTSWHAPSLALAGSQSSLHSSLYGMPSDFSSKPAKVLATPSNGCGIAQPFPHWLRDYQWGMFYLQVSTSRQGWVREC